jgi:hypothetical protein
MMETLGPIEANDLLTGCAVMATIIARSINKQGTRANPDPPDCRRGWNLEGRHHHRTTCLRGVGMAGRSIGAIGPARQCVSFEFSTSPAVNLREGGGTRNPAPRRRWISLIFTLFYGVLLCASLGGNAWQNRRFLRDQALVFLRPDQPVVRIETNPATKGIAAELAKLRIDEDSRRKEDRAIVQSLREQLAMTQERFDLTRTEVETLRKELAEAEESRRGWSFALKNIIGELIRKGQLPPEYSTAF